MKEKNQPGKWYILAVGAAIQILTGIPAAWGVFQRPVVEQYGLEESQAGLAFSLLIGAFGIGCVIGGYLQDRKGPRAAGLWGTALLSGGFFCAAFLEGKGPGLFYLGFSIPAGLGCAFLYPAVMSCAQKWYRSRKGLATGIIGGAVGFSGAFLTLFVRWVNGQWGLPAAFLGLGSLMLLVCGGGSLLLKNPPPAKQEPRFQGKKYKEPPFDLPPKKMLRTRQYWLAAGVVALATPTVLLFSPIIVQLGQERGLSENMAHLSIMIGSVGSAAGRLLCPLASDRYGRRAAYTLLFGLLAALSAGFIFAQGWLVILCYTALTFCYSGQAAILPSLSTDLFGMPHAGVNYGFLALGMTAGSLGSHFLAQSFEGELVRHFIAIGAAVGGIICIRLLKPTQGERL